METDTAGYDPVNLGNPGEFTMRELAEIVLEMTGAQVPVTFRDLPRDDPHQRCPDITRAKRLLGWTPRIPLREGLAPTIAYFREQVRARQQLMENQA